MRIEDIKDDIARMDHNDPEINKALEYLRSVYKKKGLPYHELFQSRTLGNIKYLLKELHDANGTVLITDLDTNETRRYIDEHPKERFSKDERQRQRIKEWIEYSKR